MRLLSATALVVAIGAAHGFQDTSPFFMFSTFDYADLHHTAGPGSQLRNAESLSSEVSSTLPQCSTELYIIVSQPGVQSLDYALSKTTPALSMRISNGRKLGIRSGVKIDEVVGDVDVEEWHTILKEVCGANVVEVDAAAGIPAGQIAAPAVYSVRLPAPTSLKDLAENDAFFASILDTVQNREYTVLYATSIGEMSRGLVVAESGGYEMDRQTEEYMHIDLRRDLNGDLRRRADNETLVAGPLFDRYQFLTPGLFMGFFVGLILLSIAYVGISALASLQVSYAAFDRESGQLAMKKAQ